METGEPGVGGWSECRMNVSLHLSGHLSSALTEFPLVDTVDQNLLSLLPGPRFK